MQIAQQDLNDNIDQQISDRLKEWKPIDNQYGWNSCNNNGNHEPPRERDDDQKRSGGSDGWETSDPWKRYGNGSGSANSWKGVRGGQAFFLRAEPWENASTNIVASVGGLDRETGKEGFEADIAKIIALVDVDVRDFVKRHNCLGPNANYGFITFKDGCVEDDIWRSPSSFNSNAFDFTIKK